jgi:hypothetical protein
VGDVPLVAYALIFIVSLSGVSALEAYHRDLLRDSVGGSEVCCRLDTGLVYHIWSRGGESRNGYYWEAKERRESGEDMREFEELLKRDSEEFDRRRKTMTGIHQLLLFVAESECHRDSDHSN